MRIFAPLFACTALLVASPCGADDSDAAMMKACPGLAAWAAKHHPAGGESTEQRDAHRQFSQPALRQDLIARSASDQKARQAYIIAGMRDEAASKAVQAVDADNLSWLKAQVAAHGFPTTEQVGEVGVMNAFLLVQHADTDHAFQAMVLKQMQAQPAGGIPKSDIAMLTDRVLRAQGRPQRYGSQFGQKKDGSWVLQPTEDLDHLERRRAAMDLMPMADYRCVMRAAYAPARKPAA